MIARDFLPGFTPRAGHGGGSHWCAVGAADGFSLARARRKLGLEEKAQRNHQGNRGNTCEYVLASRWVTVQVAQVVGNDGVPGEAWVSHQTGALTLEAGERLMSHTRDKCGSGGALGVVHRAVQEDGLGAGWWDTPVWGGRAAAGRFIANLHQSWLQPTKQLAGCWGQQGRPLCHTVPSS